MQRFLNTLLVISIIIGIILVLNSWHYNQTFPKEEIKAAFEPITSKYGIKIVYEISDDFFSPLENPPIPVKDTYGFFVTGVAITKFEGLLTSIEGVI